VRVAVATDPKDRLLLVDGPLRGYDIPLPGGHRLMIPGWDLTNPEVPVVHAYAIRFVRDEFNHAITLGFYEGTTHAR